IFYIVPEKCTECVGFYDQEACAKVCPVDSCVPDPALPESEALLLERARALHTDKTIPDDAPSRFKKEGAAGPAAAKPAAEPKPAAPAPAAAAPAPAAAPAAAADDNAGLALPDPDEWEIPIACFRCSGEYTVPFRYFRAGVGFSCPHCSAPTRASASRTEAGGRASMTPSRGP